MRYPIRFLVPLLFATSLARADTPAEATQVSVVDGDLHYAGRLDEQANRRLFALYGSLDPKPSVLTIKSEGGGVTVGMELGAWVHAHELDVRVVDYCLSSCANYVFPAGRRKIVGHGAIVGYHGGAGSTYRQIAAGVKAARKKPLSKGVRAALAQMLGDLDEQAQQEAAFLAKIGVRINLVSLGQEARYRGLYKENPRLIGWTYSVEGFARMGVRGIEVLAPPWSPRPLSAEQQFVVLPLE